MTSLGYLSAKSESTVNDVTGYLSAKNESTVKESTVTDVMGWLFNQERVCSATVS